MAVLLVACGALFIFYALFGYPLVLLVLARVRPRPVRRNPRQGTVSVLIPVRNGERWVADKLRSVFALRYPRELLQVLVISDGSSDRSAAEARRFEGVEVIELPPGGKPKALNAGMARATGEFLFFTDVRQPLEPDCLANLLANFSDPEVGVASGELVLVRGDRQEHASIGLYMRYEEWLRKRISDVASVAGATGAVYAMRRELAVPLPEDILLDDVYQPLAAYFQGYRVILDGAAVAYDYPTVMGDEFRRKVRTLAGLYQILGRFPGLWDPRRDICFHFFSHKLSRLLLPYAFLLVLISSFWLPGPFAPLLLGAQGLFYGLALTDFLLPETLPLKRISSVARTFLTLLAASLAAISILFVPARKLWGERK